MQPLQSQASHQKSVGFFLKYSFIWRKEHWLSKAFFLKISLNSKMLPDSNLPTLLQTNVTTLWNHFILIYIHTLTIHWCCTPRNVSSPGQTGPLEQSCDSLRPLAMNLSKQAPLTNAVGLFQKAENPAPTNTLLGLNFPSRAVLVCPSSHQDGWRSRWGLLQPVEVAVHHLDCCLQVAPFRGQRVRLLLSTPSWSSPFWAAPGGQFPGQVTRLSKN